MAYTLDQFDDGLILKSIIDELLPEHVSANYPELVAAFKNYADFLEHINGAGHHLNTVDIQRDIDRVESEFLEQLQKEVGAPIPRQFAADPRIFYKRITEFYRSRGTPDSIKAFFRILYNDDVEIYFPKEDMFIPSDGKWYSQREAIIANPDGYSPLFTYNISTQWYTEQGLIPNIIFGEDVNGRALIYDNPIVFVNGVHRTDFKAEVKVNNTTSKLDYFLTFDVNLEDGDVVEIYRDGSFSTNDGFISDYKKIQDSFFYQKFSYVLRTGTNTDVWKNAFNRLVHPAGFIFFGEILLFLDTLGQATPLRQPGYQIGGLPFPIIIPAIDGGASFVKTRNNQMASYITIGLENRKGVNNIAAQALYWERNKFIINDLMNNIGSFTFQDAINKTIKNKINVQIDIS